MLTKDPTADLDYAVDWSQWLAAGETISTAVWDVPAGLTSHDDTIAGSETVIWLGSGTENKVYYPSVTVTTSAGRTDRRFLEIRIASRYVLA